MSIVDALNGLNNNQFAYETAKYAKSDYSKYNNIRVERISERERRFSPYLRNMFSDTDNIGLKTSYLHDYKIGEFIQYRSRWYQISAITEINNDIAPMAMAVGTRNRQYAFSLIEAEQK